MRLSRYFLKTTKSVSADEKSISARFFKQGGYIAESAAGRFYFLPIGQRVQQKIMSVIKEEMDACGAQEMVAPILHPLELWKETNRTDTAGFELMKVKDRRDAEFALGGTAEEMFVDLVRKYKLSYQDLPFQLYQFSPKFRDELRARGGLLRVREFIMKDGYSFHRDEEDFRKTYEEMKKVYLRIYERLGLKVSIVESDNGYIGGEYCHEFIVEAPIGESKYFVAENGDYAAHEDIAVFEKDVKNMGEALEDMREVDARRACDMEAGAAFHKLPLWQQIKDVMFVDETGRFVLAIIRGDMDVNEVKLKNTLHAVDLRPATEEELREKVGTVPGFISPVGIRNNLAAGVELVVVADESLRTIANAYGGSNKQDRDLLNMNIDRDFTVDLEGDIALAKAGYEAKGGQGKLIEKVGIEVANIFQLGFHYSNKMKGAVYVDSDGKEKPFYMGCYGIGVGRNMAAIAEVHHDEKGIIWPDEVAPFAVELIALDGATAQADGLYEQLIAKKVEVLYDDRSKNAGEKFADADLIGLPLRAVVSKKTLATGNNVELKRRCETEAKLVTFEEFIKMF
jgi:prolyl-tRNA synthetase